MCSHPVSYVHAAFTAGLLKLCSCTWASTVLVSLASLHSAGGYCRSACICQVRALSPPASLGSDIASYSHLEDTVCNGCPCPAYSAWNMQQMISNRVMHSEQWCMSQAWVRCLCIWQAVRVQEAPKGAHHPVRIRRLPLLPQGGLCAPLQHGASSATQSVMLMCRPVCVGTLQIACNGYNKCRHHAGMQRRSLMTLPAMLPFSFLNDLDCRSERRAVSLTLMCCFTPAQRMAPTGDPR